MRIAAIILFAVAWWTVPLSAALPIEGMVTLTLDGQKVEGSPLAWNARRVHLLGRDGRLWEFAPRKAADFRKTSNRFRSYSPSEFRSVLLRELGNEFEVTGTGHYLVAHPRGQRDKWAQRFEELYRAFVRYFSIRDFRPVEPPFPLIGVVCKDRNHFYSYAAKSGSPMPGGVLGFYDPESNRIVLYDTQAKASSSNWQLNAATIIHEATHQTAFNTGVHNRYTPPPVWVAEGLATMFEAPGVYDSRHHTRRSDRINRNELRSFKKSMANDSRSPWLKTMLAADRLFRANPTTAYARAWALTFYLIETQPQQYAKYLTRTAKRPSFTAYTSDDRVADFTTVFGDDWDMLQARLVRFMESVE